METATHIFHVKSLHCDDCATLIDTTLRGLLGVRNAHATVKTREIRVELNPRQISPDSVSAAITELGFQLKLPPPAPTAGFVAPQVSDRAWQVLEPLFREGTPSQARRTRDERQIFEGIAYKHRAAVSWREVPPTFGPWQTLYARCARWRSDGTWAKLAAAARNSAVADELAWIESARE